jgi:CRP/FNR family nitrogen fixation transcriptional regulator
MRSRQRNIAEAAGTPRTLVKGQKIFSEGQAANFFYKVATGVVRTYTILEDGRRQITGFHLEGDILGLEAGSRHRFSASGLCDVTVIAFKRSDLNLLLATDTAFRAEILSSLLASLEHAQNQVLLMGRKSAREKVAQFLLDLAHRASKSKTSDLPMRRSDIADFLGMSRETASRALTQRTCDGVIRTK